MNATVFDGIRAVTFDVGGTLIEPWPSVGHVYAAVAARHGLEVSALMLTRRFSAAWKARKNFAHTRAQWAALVDETFAGLADTPPSATFFEEIYEEFARASAWRIYEDARPCLAALKQRGLPLGVISNWDERLLPLLRQLELRDYFDCVIASAEIGSTKPDPKIFLAAASRLGESAASILHVGDSAREDLEGAQGAGFGAVLIERGGLPSGAAHIKDLRELGE